VNPDKSSDRTYPWRDDVRAFVQQLRARCGTRHDAPAPQPGARARLRQGAAESRRHLAYSEIIRCGGRIRRYDGSPDYAWLAVGAAFAFYPQPERGPGRDSNFGVTCRKLAEETRKADGNSSFDPKFRRLLAAESEKDLAKWIVPVVKRARNAKPAPHPVHYEELLTALLNWDAADGSRRERIRVRWATSYWQASAVESEKWTEL
jgi:CRISPR type I-E-associated protein CasB/Cse2